MTYAVQRGGPATYTATSHAEPDTTSFIIALGCASAAVVAALALLRRPVRPKAELETVVEREALVEAEAV